MLKSFLTNSRGIFPNQTLAMVFKRWSQRSSMMVMMADYWGYKLYGWKNKGQAEKGEAALHCLPEVCFPSFLGVLCPSYGIRIIPTI